MNDLEITKLCAEAMGTDHEHTVVSNGRGAYWTYWRPLTADSQAMALVKKFGLEIIKPGAWVVSYGDAGVAKNKVKNIDLNRAICECVAKMQASK